MRRGLVGLGLAMGLAACVPGGLLSVGDRAPTFDLPTVAGGEVALDDLRGKPALLYFHMAVG
jgi:hypothetical protein